MGPGAADIAQVVPEIATRLAEPSGPATAGPGAGALPPVRQHHHLPEDGRRAAALVLVLDDLHWADTPSLLLLQFLAHAMESARLLVLGTYRDVEVEPQQPLFQTLGDVARQQVTRRLVLSGLTERDLATYIEMTAGIAAAPRLVAEIAHETEGNPFFVAEVVRLLIAEGGIERLQSETRWSRTIPQGVREVIGRRLARLSAACHETLRIGAVIGREFGVNILESTSAVSRVRLLELLEEAARARIISEVPGALGRYRFAHALVRETLYDALTMPERVRLHRQVGEALERAHAVHLQPYLAELAHHFSRAAVAGDVRKAVDYARRAGERAVTLLAYEDAVAHYERALQTFELTEERSEGERAELLLALGDARYRAGRMREARETFEQTAALARHLAAPELLARTALRVGSGWIYVAQLDELRYRLLEEASRALPPEDSALRALVLAWLARALYQRPGTRARRAALSREAVEMAGRVADPTTLFFVLNCAYQAVWEPETLEQRAAIAADEIRLAEQLGDGVLAVLAHLDLLCSYLERGDITAVDREIAIYNRLATELRDPSHSRYVASLGAMRALLDGQFQRVPDSVMEFHAAAVKAHDRDAGGSASMVLIELDRETGDIERWVSVFEIVAEQMTEQAASAAEPRCVLSLLYAATGRVEQARREFDRLAAHDFAESATELGLAAQSVSTGRSLCCSR